MEQIKEIFFHLHILTILRKFFILPQNKKAAAKPQQKQTPSVIVRKFSLKQRYHHVFDAGE